jgi:hypothetical protein
MVSSIIAAAAPPYESIGLFFLSASYSSIKGLSLYSDGDITEPGYIRRELLKPS